MLKSMVTSLCVLSTASMTALMCCLLTCMAYLVSIEMTCTNVSYCCVCVLISWFTFFLMSLTSLVMAVLVSQLRASPKKGKRLVLVHLLKGDMPLKEGSVFSNGSLWVWEVYKMYRCCPSLLILPEMLTVDIVKPVVSVVGNLVFVLILLSVV